MLTATLPCVQNTQASASYRLPCRQPKLITTQWNQINLSTENQHALNTTCSRHALVKDHTIAGAILCSRITNWLKPWCRSATAERLRISHFLGVSWDRHSSMWQARFCQPDGTSHFIGHFQKAEAAGRAYDEHALQQGGPSAVRNAMPSTLTGILLRHMA